MDREFVIENHTIVLINRINPYAEKWFSFYIFNRDGKLVLMGDGGEHKELNQELADRIYRMYLHHQKMTEQRIKQGKLKPLRERMKNINPDSPLMKLFRKNEKRAERFNKLMMKR